MASVSAYPTEASTEAVSGGTDWSYPEGSSLIEAISTSNDIYATCSGEKSYWLKCSNFGFDATIPVTARIVGLEVLIEGKSSGTTIDNEVYLCYKGERIGSNRAHSVEWTSIENIMVHGGSYDTWGLRLAAANDLTGIRVIFDSFGVHISVKNDGGTASIDSVEMVVHYLENQDTEIQICNEALAKIGEPPITSLEGTDARSKNCALSYSSIRQRLLTSHIWHFALVECKLKQSLMPPAFGWAYSFDLPSNFLKACEIYPSTAKYEIGAGNVLYTNTGDGYLKYVADVIDPALFSFDFKEALIYKLALALYPVLVDKATGYQVFQREATYAIQKAIHSGTVHQRPSKETFTWLTNLTEAG